MAPSTLFQTVQEKELADFGFLIIRTVYGDEDAFEKWGEEFSNLLEKAVVTGTREEDKMLDKLMTAFIDDGELHGVGWEGIRVFFEDCQDNNMVPPGLDVGFCLVVDQEAMDSLLKPVAGGEEPWVWAVDTEFEEPEEGEPKGDYPGYLKVAISSVVTEFWPLIAKQSLSGEQLWARAKPVWKGGA